MSRPIITLLASAMLIVLANQAMAERLEKDRALEFSVLLVGNVSGTASITQGAPGHVVMTTAFNDRGRGPELEASYQLDANGYPHTLRITGLDYTKNTVDERLDTVDGQRRWSSSADSGHAVDEGFYLTLDGPPIDIVLLAQALLDADQHSVPILPLGTAHITRVASRQFDGIGTLQLFEIGGLGFEPEPLWLDEDQQLFAIAGGWLNIIRSGSEHLLDDLNEIQNTQRNQYHQNLARAATVESGDSVLIDNARVFDVVAGRMHSANAVWVADGKIRSLLQPSDPRPKDVMVIDAGQRMLLPGLWDMHTHMDLIYGPLNLAAGVTTVRDLANDPELLAEIEQRFDSGDAAGPHILKAGIIDGTGPYAGPTKARVETAEQAEHWVDFYAARGYAQIKIYSSVPTELVPVLIARAQHHNLRVSGHIPAGMWAADAVKAGYNEIQHINMVFLNFYRDIVETRNPDRFIKVAERGADLKPDSTAFQQFVQLLLDNQVVVDPTVAVFMNLFAHQKGQLAPTLKSAAGRLPPAVYRANLTGGLPVPVGWEERYNASAQQMLSVIAALHEAGVPLVAGTDDMPGFTLQAELAYYQEAGISAPDILYLATVGSARVMGLDQEAGSISPGLRADLILVDGRPDQDINDIQKVNWVMREGRIFDPARLYQGLSIKP